MPAASATRPVYDPAVDVRLLQDETLVNLRNDCRALYDELKANGGGTREQRETYRKLKAYLRGGRSTTSAEEPRSPFVDGDSPVADIAGSVDVLRNTEDGSLLDSRGASNSIPGLSLSSTKPPVPLTEMSVTELNALKLSLRKIISGSERHAEDIRRAKARYKEIRQELERRAGEEEPVIPIQTEPATADDRASDLLASFLEEKRKLNQALHQYLEDFTRTHGRPMETLEDKAPIMDVYRRYKDVKARIAQLTG